jgi:hypothetical protein
VRRALLACAAAVAIVASGCGSSTGAGGPADAADLAPRTTIGYASIDLAPEGDTKAGFDAAFGKLLGPDPEARLGKALTEASKEEGSKLSYEADVKPWLGRTATAILTGFARGEPDWAILLASKDDDKARAAIDKDLAGRQAVPATYRGVGYKVIDATIANGVVGHYLVAGTQRAFKAIVDTDKDGKSLSDSNAWKQSVGDRGDDRVGLGWLDLKAAVRSLLSGSDSAGAALAPLALGFVPIQPFVATLDANASSFVLDISSPGTKLGSGTAVRGLSTPLIETLPGDAWAALAIPQVGPLLQKFLGLVKANPLLGKQVAAFADGLERQTGLSLERDVLAGIGDVGVFVRGTTKETVTGGVVVAAADRAALRRTLAGLPRAIRTFSSDVAVRTRQGGFDALARGVPRPIEVRSGGPGAVATYGPGKDALAPASRLGTTPLFRKSASAIGGRPTFFMAIGPLADLIKSSGASDLSADDEAHLRRIEYLAVGLRRDDGHDVLRAVLGLH